MEDKDDGKGKGERWAPRREGWEEGTTGYFSINRLTLDQPQEGLDLREWVDKKWIFYMDHMSDTDKAKYSYDRPHLCVKSILPLICTTVFWSV